MEKDKAQRVAERFIELTPEKRQLFWQKMVEQGVTPAQLPILSRTRSAGQLLPVSYAQQRQWFLWQLSPESSAYHVAGGLRLRGEVNAAALRTSFEAIVARHEVLRTRFVADNAGRVEQRIEPAVELDWREASLQEEALDDAARALASEPFDLTHGPLLRVALFSVNGVNGVTEQEHLLVLSMHHIVSDGWSVQVLLDELVAHYRAAVLGEPLTLAPLPVQYTDYATWQREWLDAGERERQLTYWRGMLGDEHPVLALPTDAPRPAHASFHAARHGFMLPAALADAVRAQAQRNSATPFTVLLAAFHALLYRYTGQAEVRTGVPVANRHRVETEGLIGFFVNTQVLASHLDASTNASGLLAQVREATLGAQSHQDLPFDVLVDALHVQRSLSHSPLFQVMFNHQRRDWRVLQQLPGMTIEPYRLANPMAQFELLLDTREEADGTLSVEFTYARELFGAQTIGRMAQHYERLLEAFTVEGSVTPLDAIVLPGEDERDELDRWSRNPQRYEYAQPVHRLFERHAHAHPDDEALVYGETSLSYGELNARANRLAHWLIQQGIGVETKVGVAAERSVELVVALLAIMKAGAAYVPLDPSYPADRLAYMQADSGLGLLLCQRGIALPEVAGVRRIDLDTLDVTGCANSNPAVPLHGANLAYVIYTSGSTGRPKGVGNRHDALYNRLEWMQQAYGLQRGETVLQKTPFSFDVSVWEFFWPLMVGARLAVAAPGAHRDPAQLAAAIVTHRVSTLHFVPSMLQAFVASGHASRCAGVLRRIVCSGEALPAELQTRVFEVLPEVELHNLYGPTEAAIDVTSWQCRAEGGLAVPIGAPIAATQTWVLDAHMQPVPRGVAGELYLGGAGLARGYLGRPGLTAERFVPDPFDLEGRGARLYRTGDLVRWRADGVLDYLGRLDHQVKIRGFRIELGELEARLVELDGVREAVVIAHEGRLVAYVTPVTTTDAATEALDVTELKSQLARAVPDYMVPWRIVALETLPLGVNGKVERRALPLPQAAATDDSPKEAPHGETETHLAAIWSQLLNVEHIGRHDNFFDLGGDSILGLQIVARARQAGLVLSARQVFEQQTIAQLAACAIKADANTHDSMTASTRVELDGIVPLLPIQSWFFAQQMPQRHHWNQSVLLRSSTAPDLVHLEQALQALVAHHDCLRLRFEPNEPSHDGSAAWVQRYAHTEPAPLLHVENGVRAEDIEAYCDDAQRSLNLTNGPLVRAIAFALDDGNWRLFMVIHHLAVDAVSWRVLLGDLQLACAQLAEGNPIALPPRTTSYQAFARQLHAAAQTPRLAAQLDYWQALASVPASLSSTPRGERTLKPVSATLRLDQHATRRLLQEAPAAYRTQINDLLLVALGRVLCSFAGHDALRIDLEGHGRDPQFGDADLSRTVGWFTTLYPVSLQPTGDLPVAVKRVKENLRAVPDSGMGFGILKYLGTSQQRAALAAVTNADVVFNYLGQLDGTLSGDAQWQLASGRTGASQDEQSAVAHPLEVMGQVLDGELSLTLLHRRGDCYDAATLDTLARDLETELLAVIEHCTSGASGITPSDVPLAAIDQARLDALPVSASSVADLYPLAPMQTGIVFHSLLGEQPGAYVNQLRIDIDGLDCTRFRTAWEAVLTRHDVLRTGFLQFDDAPRQWVARHVTLPFVEQDWRDRHDVAAALDTFATADIATGFDIERPALLRLALIRTAERRHHFVWTFHHALLDGWSMAQLLAEVLRRYDGTTIDAVSDARPGRYRDFIAWLAGRDAAGDASSESWWRTQVARLDGPTLLGAALPTPHAEDVDAKNGRFGNETLAFDAGRTAQWTRFAKTQRVTLNTLVQAAWLLLLQRYTGQRAVTFGATVAGRPEALADAQRTLGLFINTIPVVAEPQPATTVAHWLEQIQQQGVVAREHEHVPLYEIQRWAQLEGGQPLFDSIVVFENYPVDDVLKSAAPQGLTFSNLQASEQTNYPLTLSVTHTQRTQPDAAAQGALQIDFAYARDVFDTVQIERIAAHLSNLLDAFAADPARALADVPMLSAGEQTQLQSWGNAARAAFDPTPVHRRIAAQAGLRPDGEALVLGSESIDYDTLNRRANRIAHRLRAHGVGAESRVGVAIERSIDMIVALLAVLKAGAAYVPLDPAYPAERIAWMVTDSGIEFALTAPAAAGVSAPEGVTTLDVTRCGDGQPDHDPQVPVHGEQLAYLIYTSGSTGRPKGVGITHAALAQHTGVSIDLFGLSNADRVLQFSTFNFDGFVEQVFPSLCSGAAVILRGPDLWSSERFLDEVETGRITVADLTTAYWNALAQDFAVNPRAGSACASLRRVHAGGEAMPADGVRAWRAAGLAHIELANTYGPSEATVTATAFDCAPYLLPHAVVPAQISLGTPLAGRRLVVLDARLEPVPVGVAGELHIGGPLLARGYHRRPGLTAERFIADPFAAQPGGRLYRTGDIVRWNEQGTLDYLGRADHQVKVRGFRIELGEIEAQLLGMPEVREAAVIAREGAGGLRVLAYVTLAKSGGIGSGIDGAALRARLAGALPDYMVPSTIMVLDVMPLSPGGKLDRHALPVPAQDDRAQAFAAPQGDLEIGLAQIWATVLGVQTVGRQDTFFELGGHSLAAMQVQAALRRTLSLDAPLAVLMTNQSLHAVAQALAADSATAAPEGADASLMLDLMAQL
ncbi:amino acid adenylation domain-containing protein [Paraburkholderia acidicola]|uniref:Amino acid adenylation domain-containing protein n=1 Tax=Paraburkholderia acidicola TaxID=1912599 RepID=A0ABV1LJ56_9BURK